jgi:hypothetical protein
MTTPFGGHGAGRAAAPGHRDEAVVPGHRDKYALVERERRFLLSGPLRAHGHLLRMAVATRAELLGWLAEFGLGLGLGAAGVMPD